MDFMEGLKADTEKARVAGELPNVLSDLTSQAKKTITPIYRPLAMVASKYTGQDIWTMSPERLAKRRVRASGNAPAEQMYRSAEFAQGANINHFDYGINAGHGYPEVTAENKKALSASLSDGSLSDEDFARTMVALEMNPLPLNKREQASVHSMQERASFDNPSTPDAIYAALMGNLNIMTRSMVPVLAPTVLGDLYEEDVSSTHMRAEELGLDYDAYDHFWGNAATATINGALEIATDRLGARFIKGVPIKSLLVKVGLKNAKNAGLRKAALRYASAGLQHALLEGGTEISQYTVSSVMQEAQLMDMAEEQGKEYTPRSIGDILGSEEARKSFEGGVLGGAGPVIIGAPLGITKEYLTASHIDAKETRDRLKNSAADLGSASFLDATTELKTVLEGMETAALLQEARKVDGTVRPESRDQLMEFIMGNRMYSTEFHKLLDKNLQGNIESSDLSAWDKDAMKWMHQGDITLDEIAGVKMTWTKVAKEAGYSSLDAMWADRSAQERTQKQGLEFLQSLEDKYEGDPIASKLLEHLQGRDYLSHIMYDPSPDARYNPTEQEGQAFDAPSALHEGLHHIWGDVKTEVNEKVGDMSVSDAIALSSWIGRFHEPMDTGRVIRPIYGSISEGALQSMRTRWSAIAQNGTADSSPLTGDDAQIVSRMMDELLATVAGSYSLTDSSLQHDDIFEGFETAKGEGLAIIDNVLGNNVMSLFTDLESFKPKLVDSKFMQKGKETESGSPTLRGRTTWNSEGKFIVDLFKGGDVLTLQHELAHALSPHIDSGLMDTLIDKILREDPEFALRSIKSIKGTKQYMQNVWTSFVKNPNDVRFTTGGADYTYITSMQEMLANQFQTYLSTKKAPTKALEKVFVTASKRMMEYYKDIRSLPIEMQYVDNEIAEFFDEMISSEGIEYTRTESEIGGHKVLQATRKRIKGALQKVDTKNYSAETVQMVAEVMDGIDNKGRTYKRVKKGFDLQKLIERKLLDGDTPIELLSISEKDLASLVALDEISFYQMSNQQLMHLEDALMEIINWDEKMANQFVENKLNHHREQTKRMHQDLLKHWRMQKVEKRVMKELEAEEIPLVARNNQKWLKRNYDKWAGVLWNPTRGLRSIARALEGKGGNTLITELLDNLSLGRDKQFAFGKNADEFFYQLTGDMDLDGVSDLFGEIKKADKQKIRVIDKRGRKVRVPVSQGELMLWYGYMQNRHGRSHLVDGGFRFRDSVDELYKFESMESAITAVETLPEELKQVVRSSMEYMDKVIASEINKVSNQLIGRDIATEENYLPLFVEWLDRGADGVFNMSEMGDHTQEMFRTTLKDGTRIEDLSKRSNQFVQQMVQHMSFTKSRTGGTNPLYVTDFFTGVSDNLDDVALYVGMAAPLAEMRATLFADSKVSERLITMFGKKKADRIKQWLNTIEDPSSRRDEATNNAVRATQRIKKGIIKLSASISLMQLLSVHVARNAGLDRKYLARVMVGGMLDPSSIGSGAKYTKEELAQMHPYLYDRFTRLPINDLGTSKGARAKRRFKGNKTVPQQIKEANSWRDGIEVAKSMDEATAEPIRNMDSWAFSKIIEAAELKAKDMGWDEQQLWDYVLPILRTTQPQTDPLYTSSFLQSRDPFIRIVFGVFHSFRDIVRGEMQSNIEILRDAYHGQAQKGDVKIAVANMVRTTVVTNLAVAMIQEAFYRIGKDGDDEDDAYIEGVLIRTLANIAGLVPFAGDLTATAINAALRDWRMSSGGLLIIEQPLKAAETGLRAMKAFEAGEDEEGMRLTISMLAETGTVFGLGTANLDRYISKIQKELE